MNKIKAREIANEDKHFKKVLARVKELIGSLDVQAKKIGSIRTSHSQSRLESEALLNHTLSRQDKLFFAQDKLLFGKLELLNGDCHYIGKVGVSDSKQEKLLIDWRAPLASKYYQASHKDNLGVAKKRTITVAGEDVVNLYDEIFDETKAVTPNIESKDSQLLNELSKRRTGKMGDVISTLQSEQDRIMRIPDSGPLIVDGPPGTGKTVIALHRAAYLLYNNKDRITNRGVLVVGPNQRFLEYIENVLPSLGEDEVNLRETSSLIDVPTKILNGRDYRKSGKAMYRALEEITSNMPILPNKNVEIDIVSEKITFTSNELHELLSQAKNSKDQYNEIREVFLLRLIEESVQKLCALRNLEEVDDLERYEMAQELRESSNFRKIANSLFMPFTPERLLYKLAKDDNLLKSVAGPYYKNISEIFKTYVDSYKNMLYQRDDLFILDYLNQWLGDASVNYVDQPEYDWNQTQINFDSKIYSHIIVDEAQDLSYLEWITLSNRLGIKSMTVVGDWGQRSAETGIASWDEVLNILGKGVKGRIEKLSINYRTPKEIMDYALKVAGPSYDREIVSLRSIPESLEFLEVSSQSDLEKIITDLGDASLIIGEGYTSPILCKGLESDQVLLINPRKIIELYGREAFFVALTRSTQKLIIVDF